MKNYYVLDMEWNHTCSRVNNGKGNVLIHEIIQMGIVKVEDNQITDKLLINVQPCVLGFVSKNIEKLTKLSYHALKKERIFPSAARLLFDFIGDLEHAVIFTWDTKDMDVLEENCEYWELPFDSQKVTHIDLQASVAKKYFQGMDGRKSVGYAMEHFGLVSEGRAHNALTDAQNEGHILLKAFVHPEEACEYYDKNYFLWMSGKIVVEPFLAACGERQIAKVLKDNMTSLCAMGESAELLYPRYRRKNKYTMVWKEGEELFAEECRMEGNVGMLLCCVKKISQEQLEVLEQRYQKHQMKEKRRRMLRKERKANMQCAG